MEFVAPLMMYARRTVEECKSAEKSTDCVSRNKFWRFFTDAVAVLKHLKTQWQNTPPNWVRHDPCGRRWDGIFCNGPRVTAILLSGINLIGSLPEEIMLFSELKQLDLSDNKGLHGPLPLNFGRLKNLARLVLSGCNFSGPIPESIGSLLQLERLFLNSNNFSGPIPHSIGNLQNLIWLDLTENQLDGNIPVSNKTMPGLDNLSKAEHFHLGQNKLSGEIPLGLFRSDMALRHLILNDNLLNGNIPETLGLVEALEVIRLDRNSLSGLVPRSLKFLINVSELYLSNNNLSGPIPNLFGMIRLTYIDLSNNNFDASNIPLWFTTSPYLTTIRMENTSLTGQVPVALFNQSNLQMVLLRNNRLNGTVDIRIRPGSNLHLIDLRNNFIDEFISEDFSHRTHNILLDDNPFCDRAEGRGICMNVKPLDNSKFIPEVNCVSLSCYSDFTGSDCRRPYLGRLAFLSFNFSNLENLTYYNFLDGNLKNDINNQSLLVTKICLASSMVETKNDYLVLEIAYFPPAGIHFDRTVISRIGNILNDHIFETPYGPYHFFPVPYNFSEERSHHISLIIGLSTFGFVLIVLIIFAGAYAYRQRKIARKVYRLNNPFSSWSHGDLPQLNGIRCFSFEDVKQCTNNFTHLNEIGVGGYGKVYKGKLDNGQLVAIKKAQEGSLQGAIEFKTEIELLSRVHHKNIVNLVGFCYDKGEQMLIYEYVRNGSLRASLSGPTPTRQLPLSRDWVDIWIVISCWRSGVRLKWTRRLKVSLGAARGLAYMHEFAEPPIIHRDIKSENILLDGHLNAKVGDFGLSKPFSNDRDHLTSYIKGTVGYLDPEYLITQRLTEKSDVYSFGVVMLELVSGRLPIENKVYIVREVKATMDETGYIYNLVDPEIRSGNLIGVEEFIELALKCVEDSGHKRPTMGEVVKELESIIQAGKNNLKAVLSSYEGTSEGSTSYSNSCLSENRGSCPLLR
ncbi:leucine-rich repeat receptor protein kinase HPCA1 isoform X4 [Beta vulgaris subsp. vulgaris]|uniref:leucine-rich repeat receptor protein kinase HPCA1 isoform X4 n=1 Tax=Beta vulgaris subsp. vulgaris TaxID=3555 RepID=UPI0020370121|nr:leucine-rich repeat receptor protein kinase HPCA1 isoform X4 [Beta vulgaris subsp. vulgaris]